MSFEPKSAPTKAAPTQKKSSSKPLKIDLDLK